MVATKHQLSSRLAEFRVRSLLLSNKKCYLIGRDRRILIEFEEIETLVSILQRDNPRTLKDIGARIL